MRWRAIVEATILCCAASARVDAQLPGGLMQVKAEPNIIPPGGLVTLTGALPLKDPSLAGRRFTVRITLPPPPSGPMLRPITLPVTADTLGRFMIEYEGANTIGDYKVVAVAPGGLFTAEGAFFVADVDDVTSLFDSTMKHLMAQQRDLESVIGTLIDKLPPSPERVRAKEKFAAARKQLAEARAVALRLREGLDAAGRLMKALPPSGGRVRDPRHRAMGTFVREMDQWVAMERARRPQVMRALEASKAAGVRCEVIDQLNEGIQLTSAMFTLGAMPFGILVGFATDYVASRNTRPTDTPGEAFAAGQSIKQLHTLNDLKGKTFSGAFTAMVDLTSTITKWLFEKYCESMSGPMTASMSAEFAHRIDTWWKYSFDLGGRLILRYAKGPKGAAVAVRGEFLGNGHNFRVAWKPGLDPEFLANTGSILFHWLSPPIVAIPPELRPEFEGKAVEMLLTPKSFFIPVTGEIVGDKVTLVLDAARFDFEESTEARGYYLHLSPLSMMIGFQDVPLPFKGAHHTIFRAASDGAIVLPITRTEKEEYAKGTFRRVKDTGSRSAANTKATYTMSLRICAGGCS